MNSSIRLLLEEFLGLMREEGELDLFLPLLFSAMGHEIVFRSQKGLRQYGVDISTVGVDKDDGRQKLFLWVVKRGNLGRADWDTTKQSIRQSINDVGDTYLDTHIAPQHAKLPRKLVVVTNGDISQALALTISTFFKRWTRDYAAEAAIMNGSMLAAWAEEYLLDEHLLPPESRALLRRMLVNVATPELSIAFGRDLIQGYVRSAKEPGKSKSARRKRLLVGLRAVRASLCVLYRWGMNEENLTAPYRLAEFAVLAVWAAFHKELVVGENDVQREFRWLLEQWTAVALTYHGRLEPYYYVRDALALPRRDSLLVADAAFTELGRLGLQAIYWGLVAKTAKREATAVVHHYVTMIETLLESHSCTASPAYDHHSGDLHVAMVALLVANKHSVAKAWVERLAIRLEYAAQRRQYWPLATGFEDALSVRWGETELADEFMKITTLVPVLLLWTAVLDMPQVYAHIRGRVCSAIPDTTLNFWSSDAGYDAVLAEAKSMYEHGVGEGLGSLPDTPSAFLAEVGKPLEGVEPIEKAAWYEAGLGFIPLLAGLHWRLQVPREMLVKHATALCSATSV